MTESKRKTRTKTEIGPSDNLTPKQASDYLNVPEGTLAVWRSTNRVVLPYFKMGHHVRYRRSDLDAFIAQNMRNRPAPSASPEPEPGPTPTNYWGEFSRRAQELAAGQPRIKDRKDFLCGLDDKGGRGEHS